jgi:hypothetical protein
MASTKLNLYITVLILMVRRCSVDGAALLSMVRRCSVWCGVAQYGAALLRHGAALLSWQSVGLL